MTLSPATAQTTDPELLRAFEINQMGEITPNVSVDYSALGTPAFVRSTTAYLTRRLDAAPLDIVAAFVNDNPALFGVPFPEEGANGYRVIRNYVTPTLGPTGVRHITLQQRHSGQDVFGCLLTANVTGDGMLVNIGSTFHEVGNGLASPPTCGARDAISAACAHMNDDRTNDFLALVPENTECLTDWKAGQLLDEDGLFVKSIWYATSVTSVVQAWYIGLPPHASQSESAWACIVEHGTGVLLTTFDAVVHFCQPDLVTYKVYTSDSPVPGTPGLSTLASGGSDSECAMRALLGLPECPNALGDTRSLIEVSAGDMPGSPFGWINDAGFSHCAVYNNGAAVQLCGNNVYVRTQQFEAPLVGTSNRGFVPALTWSQSLLDVAAVNVFVAVNQFHDRLASFGFDEAAGNFQHTYIGAGLGGDSLRVIIDGISGGYGTNSPVHEGQSEDGHSYTIRYAVMGDRLAALDRTVIFHELGHALSLRLHVNFFMTTTESSGLGEGWSDFLALALTHKTGDDPNANYPVFSYPARNNFASYLSHYYFGPRTYPYSTDMEHVNPLTYRFIDPGSLTTPNPPVPFPVTSVFPRNPTNLNPPRNETHFVGEVWSEMLVECRAALAVALGADAANEVMLQLVIDGMKLDPGSPKFVHARDAILAADLIRYGGVHQARLWSAFAKRGLGWSAAPVPRIDTVGIVENFDPPPASAVSFFFPDGVPPTIETCRATVYDVVVVSPGGTSSLVRSNADPSAGTIGLPATLAEVSAGRYRVVLSPAVCKQAWSTWVEATVDSVVVMSPMWKVVGGIAGVSFADDMESPTGWTTGLEAPYPPSSHSAAGAWACVDPTGGRVTPARDASPGSGSRCWVTEDRWDLTSPTATNALNDDVDSSGDGAWLESPQFSVPERSTAIVEFSQWYVDRNPVTNTPQPSANDVECEVFWKQGGVEVLIGVYRPADTAPRWQRRGLSALTGTGSAPASIVFKFIDPQPDTVVEGGIDDLLVRCIVDCEVCCDGDMNQDGVMDQDDVAYLANVVSGGENPSGVDPDFNRDGVADQDDIAALINYAAGAGCP